MATMDKFAEQKARCALAFDPLPIAPWLRICDDALVVTVNYAEDLSSLLKSIRGASWKPDKREWHFPFTSSGALREHFAMIDRLAGQAKDKSDRENEARRIASRRAEQERNERAEQRRRDMSRTPAPMRAEFLQAEKAPYFILQIEAIGAHPPKHLAPYYIPSRREWVAQIMGVDGRSKLVRAFLHGDRDYSHSNSVGSRGVLSVFRLENGPIYEVAAPKSWTFTDRYFCRIENGTLRRMTEQEVMECLEK